MLFISTKAVSIPLAKGLTDTRRPLTKIKVESAPKPRNDTDEPPFAVSSELFACVENVPCPEIGSLVNKLIRSVTPALPISSCDKLVIGDGPSILVRLMCEPVTSMRSISSSAAMALEPWLASNIVAIERARLCFLNVVVDILSPFIVVIYLIFNQVISTF